MKAILVTGAAGLIGSETVRYFAERDYAVIGIDNDMRSYFFGDEATTDWNRAALEEAYGDAYLHHPTDIREAAAVDRIFQTYGDDIELVVHTAAQPSHDWAAKEPFTDFTVNANGTLVLLEATRRFCPDATFIFCSTNKVYGDNPNLLPLREDEFRWEIEPAHRYFEGIDETMSIDNCKHSLFGASKVAADILVQEYGRYFGMKTGVFRGGCLTGPRHSGAKLHGFLSYLMRCTMSGQPYQVYGYKGKQVRDNIHSLDLVKAFFHFHQAPRAGEIYNIGGGRFSNCSMLEAIRICESIAGKKLDYQYVESNRIGDHIWWISDVGKFKRHYPQWDLTYTVSDILLEIFEQNTERWV